MINKYGVCRFISSFAVAIAIIAALYVIYVYIEEIVPFTQIIITIVLFLLSILLWYSVHRICTLKRHTPEPYDFYIVFSSVILAIGYLFTLTTFFSGYPLIPSAIVLISMLLYHLNPFKFCKRFE